MELFLFQMKEKEQLLLEPKTQTMDPIPVFLQN